MLLFKIDVNMAKLDGMFPMTSIKVTSLFQSDYSICISLKLLRIKMRLFLGVL